MDAERRRQLQEALARLADGDRSAFHLVFTLAWPVMRSFALAALRHEADAEDAAQGALMKVFGRASAFDPTRDALSFLLGTVAWECRTLRRRAFRRREEPLARATERPASAPSPEEQALVHDLERAAREVLAALPPFDVETLVAAVSDDASPRPDVPPATFRKRLERARQRLREAWSARHGTC